MRNVYRATCQFEEAVWMMAEHPGTLQERLIDALHHLVSCNLPDSMPKDLEPEFERFWARATKIDPNAVDIAPHLKGEGNINATCSAMTDAEAKETAHDLVLFHRTLDDLTRRP